MSPTQKTKKVIDLYKAGKTTSQIAQETGFKKNTVIVALRYWRVIREAPGRDVEEQVVRWLERRGNKVKHMPGDHHFDLILNGKIKIDVKSTSSGGRDSYKVQINHRQSRGSNSKKIDMYLIVFKDKARRPMYTINAKSVNRNTLSIPLDPLRSRKYVFNFVGYLDNK